LNGNKALASLFRKGLLFCRPFFSHVPNRSAVPSEPNGVRTRFASSDMSFRRLKTKYNRHESGIYRIASQLCLVLVLAVAGAAAPNNSQAVQGASAQPLTNALVALHEQYQSAPASAKSQLLRQMQTLAAKRQQLLLQLMEADPGQVLRFAIPANMRAGFPPQVQGAIEQGQQAAGVLEVLMEDRTDGARLRYGLRTAAGRLSLHFANNAPTNLLTGSHVRVKGVRVGNSLALACCSSPATTNSSSLQTVSATSSAVLGGQNTLVVLVNFQNNTTQPYTPTYASDETFTKNSNFFLENSFGQTWFTGHVAGWFTLPISSTCDLTTIASYANKAASNAGVNLSNYQRFVYAFPSASCGWWGTAYVGGTQAWISGGYRLAVLSHELGHLLGLYHSHSLNCRPSVDTGTCSTAEYGDTLDMMGNPNNFEGGDFNAFQKERLGWLNNGSSPPILTVQSNGSYTITPYEAQGSTTKALKVFRSKNASTGLTTWYYVEYRQALGFDSFLANYSNITHGVVLHLGTDSSPNSGDLLDLTPSTTSWMDVALDTGLTFTDPNTGTSFTTVSTSSTGATVSVKLGGSTTATCTRANPSISLSPSQSASVAAGTTVSFTVSVKDNDSSGCSSGNFNLAASVPSGWSGALGSSMLTLSPGGSASTTLKVTSPTGTASGFYKVGAKATNAAATSYTAAAAATYVLSTSQTLSISIHTNKTTYSRPQTVYVTVTVLKGSSPDIGASVTVNIKKSNGSVVSLSGTTGSNGTVTLNYRLKQRDPIGKYTATGITALSGSTAKVSASTSFTVQ
jgi:hypothetical protein